MICMIYTVPHVAGWEPYNLHDVGNVSGVRTYSTVDNPTSDKSRLTSAVDDLDRDLSNACNNLILQNLQALNLWSSQITESLKYVPG